MNRECRHYLVSGRVQGVWFRASTCERARELGLPGWVRNLPDGRVELVAAGPVERLKALEEWLWQGPPMARVTGVDSRPCTGEEPLPDPFEVR
ncbi:MAG: acylphosphatase [Gammaproteobacteria bacterium]|nr:MAG: acylphosphatase [Gammaproteobacteria bacterium]